MDCIKLSYQVMAILLFLDLVLWQLTSSDAARNLQRERSLRGQFKYCGEKLEDFLHEYCTTFHGPQEEERRRRRSIVNECCKESCSVRYILTSYCQEHNETKILSDFGNIDVEATTLQGQAMIDIASNEKIRRKKHIRYQRRKKRQCTCKNNKHILPRSVLQKVSLCCLPAGCFVQDNKECVSQCSWKNPEYLIFSAPVYLEYPDYAADVFPSSPKLQSSKSRINRLPLLSLQTPTKRPDRPNLRIFLDWMLQVKST